MLTMAGDTDGCCEGFCEEFCDKSLCECRLDNPGGTPDYYTCKDVQYNGRCPDRFCPQQCHGICCDYSPSCETYWEWSKCWGWNINCHFHCFIPLFSSVILLASLQSNHKPQECIQHPMRLVAAAAMSHQQIGNLCPRKRTALREFSVHSRNPCQCLPQRAVRFLGHKSLICKCDIAAAASLLRGCYMHSGSLSVATDRLPLCMFCRRCPSPNLSTLINAAWVMSRREPNVGFLMLESFFTVY